jgi:hypothetical protein
VECVGVKRVRVGSLMGGKCGTSKISALSLSLRGVSDGREVWDLKKFEVEVFFIAGVWT